MKDVLGKPFEGPVIPFGSLGEYHLVTAQDRSRCAREAAWRLVKSILKRKERDKAAFFSPSW